MFWEQDIARIFDVIKNLKSPKINFILIEDKVNKDYPDIKVVDYIYKRDNYTGLQEFKQLVTAIIELAEIRKYKMILQSMNDLIENQANVNYTEIKENIELNVMKIITNKEITDCVTLAQANIKALNQLDKASKGNPDFIKTGFKRLDKLIIGFEPGTLSIIAARPSEGKSTLAFKIAYNVAFNKTVDYYSFEMKDETLAKRNLASIAGVDYWKMRYGNFTPEEMALIIDADGEASKRDLLINDMGGIEIESLIARIKYNFVTKKTKIVLIDHLGFISSKKGENRNHQAGHITKRLKDTAKELKIPIVLLSQLSRPAKDRKDRRPHLEDLRDSGEIEQDCDLCIMLYREDMEHKDDPVYVKSNIMNCFIRKQREGATGTIDFSFLPEFMCIDEIPSHQEH